MVVEMTSIKIILLNLERKIYRLLGKHVIPILYPEIPCVVVGSTGRCGSSMVVDVIADEIIQKNKMTNLTIEIQILKKILTTFEPRFCKDTFDLRGVVKTHDFPLSDENNFLKGKNVKFIFLWGDSYLAALSVQGQIQKRGIEWFNAHQFNLRGSGSVEKLLTSDVLGFAEKVERWKEFSLIRDCFVVNYDNLWREQNRISDYLGFELKLPPKVLRKTKAVVKKPQVFVDLDKNAHKCLAN
jgi:hypothetical protein